MNDREAQLIWEAYGESYILAVNHSAEAHLRGWIGKDESGNGFFTRNWKQVWHFESVTTAQSTFCQHHETWGIDSAVIQDSKGANAGGTIDKVICDTAKSVDRP